MGTLESVLACARLVAEHWGAIAIVVTVVAIVTPALVVLLARDDHSIGDIALIELRTRDVLSRDPPLSGVYSRYGWSHPGPLMYYVYAIPYRLLGGHADALRMTALMVNVLVLGALAWLASRRGRAADGRHPRRHRGVGVGNGFPTR